MTTSKIDKHDLDKNLLDSMSAPFDVEEVYTYVFTGEEEMVEDGYIFYAYKLDNVTEESFSSLSSITLSSNSDNKFSTFNCNTTLYDRVEGEYSIYQINELDVEDVLKVFVTYKDNIYMSGMFIPTAGVWVLSFAQPEYSLFHAFAFNTPYTVPKLKASYLPENVFKTSYITTGTEDLEAGVSTLEHGKIHLVLEEV